jgi:hypothetical protein
MASNKIDFDWGELVVIKRIAPKIYKPGSKGCVCGIRIIDSEEIANHYKQDIGSKLYLIEFNTGEALEIPDLFLSSSEE